MKTETSVPAHSDHHIGGQRLKTFSLLAETLQPKTKFVPNDHHDQHQQQFSTMESATYPTPPRNAALSCVYFFIFLLKRLLCKMYCYLV